MRKKIIIILLLLCLLLAPFTLGGVIMANKYCNLQGTQKISESYNNINVGFDGVELDINNHVNGTANRHSAQHITYSGSVAGASNVKEGLDNLKNRVDQIITTPAEGVTAQEIIDARAGKVTLGTRLDGFDMQLAGHEQQINDLNFVKPSPIEVIKTKNPNRFIAHRGAMAIYPENTLVAFEKSSQKGYFGIEIDILQTADGEWIIMHDDTVDRTTNGTGAVSAMTLEEIKSLYIDAGTNITYYPNTKVPTLEEFLQVINKYNSVPCIEIKNSNEAGYHSLLALLEKYSMIERSFILSFSQTHLAAIRALNSKVPIMLNANLTSANIDWCASQGNAVISTTYNFVTESLVKEAHSKGVYVVSYSINDHGSAKAQMNMGVDWMTTDGKIV